MNCHKSQFFTIVVLLSLALVQKSMSSDSDVKGSVGEDWKGKIYWAIWGEDKIAQANYDGSNRKIFVETGSFPDALIVNVKNGFMYWTNMGQSKGTALIGSIQRCQMDNCPNTIVTIVDEGKTATPKQLALDKVNGFIYWTDRDRDLVQRSKLDGSNVETVLIFKGPNGAAPVGCAIDEENNFLYWSEKNTNRIGRIKLANLKLPYQPKKSDYMVTEGLSGPCEIKIDKRRDKIFITERYSDQISSVSLDGGIPDVIVDTELSQPVGLALDRKKGIIFISELFAQDINSVNMDGTNFKKICDGAGSYITGMFFVPKQTGNGNLVLSQFMFNPLNVNHQ